LGGATGDGAGERVGVVQAGRSSHGRRRQRGRRRWRRRGGRATGGGAEGEGGGGASGEVEPQAMARPPRVRAAVVHGRAGLVRRKGREGVAGRGSAACGRERREGGGGGGFFLKKKRNE
jgi:hypothetical protein